MTTNADVLEHQLIFDLQRQRGYYWDGKKGQYVSKWNGQPVKNSTVLAHVERFNLDYVQSNIDGLTQRFIDGKIELSEWQTKVALELKQAHVINLQIGKGGQANTTFSDYGRIGSRLRFQYQRLNMFANQIATGIPSEMTTGQIKYRASMYAKSVRSSYFAGLTQAKREAGFSEEHRYTTSTEPCDNCVATEQRGWQPIGTLPDPGVDCLGYTNCKCYKEYR